MEIIPAINCSDFNCIKQRLSVVKSQMSDVLWLHFDIADGKFTNRITWNNPQELITNYQLLISNTKKIEVHLMVQGPEKYVDKWLEAGAKRIIIHAETINEKKFHLILEKCAEFSAELMLAIKPDTDTEALEPFLNSIFFIQILAVDPGESGQKFQPKVLEKISYLRERYPDISVEVDGGINPKTVQLVRTFGAQIAVSGYYIFSSPNPRVAYLDLLKAAQS